MRYKILDTRDSITIRDTKDNTYKYCPGTDTVFTIQGDGSDVEITDGIYASVRNFCRNECPETIGFLDIRPGDTVLVRDTESHDGCRHRIKVNDKDFDAEFATATNPAGVRYYGDDLDEDDWGDDFITVVDEDGFIRVLGTFDLLADDIIDKCARLPKDEDTIIDRFGINSDLTLHIHKDCDFNPDTGEFNLVSVSTEQNGKFVDDTGDLYVTDNTLYRELDRIYHYKDFQTF